MDHLEKRMEAMVKISCPKIDQLAAYLRGNTIHGIKFEY